MEFTHAGSMETAAVLAHDPALVRLQERTAGSDVAAGSAAHATRVLTVGRGPRLRLAAELGSDATVDYQASDPATALREATAGRGVDCVFEAPGTPRRSRRRWPPSGAAARSRCWGSAAAPRSSWGSTGSSWTSST